MVIGNPPFLGNRRMRRILGDADTDALPQIYADWVGGRPDLVCYWFAKAGRLVVGRKVQRAGLVATNSIRESTQSVCAGPNRREERDLRRLVG